MQRALRLSLAESDVLSGPTGSARRANRFLVTGAAVVTAGALLAGPTAQKLNLPNEIAHRAVELTGLSASVTASPIEVYSEILSDTFDNVSALTQAILAHPLPILSQVIRNQVGYASEVGGAIAGIPAGWQTYSEGRGATFLASLQTSLDAGDVGGAVNYLSSYILYGLQATVSPVLNTLLTYTPRGSTVANPGIPQMIAQNIANVVGVVLSSTVVVSNLFQSVYGMTLSTLAAAGDGLAGFAQSVSAGDIQGAVNSLVNLPGLVVNGFLNGWQHPQSAAPFPALLTFIPVAPPTDPENGVTRTGTSIGLLGRLLVTIPQAIAAAITPATAPASAAPATAVATTAEATETATSTATTGKTAKSIETTADTVGTEQSVKTADAESTEASPAQSSSSSSSSSSSASAAEPNSTTEVTKPATSTRSEASNTRPDRTTKSATTSTSSGDQVKKSVGGSRKTQAKKPTSSASDSSSSSSSSDSSGSSD